jgi:hypothetical protein
MNNVILIILMVVLLLAAMFVIPQWRLKRAIPKVIRIFREHSAIGINNAKTLDELGLRPKGMLEGMFRGRDYKQYALSALMRAEIIQMTEDGRLYLLEDKLLTSGLDRPTAYYR